MLGHNYGYVDKIAKLIPFEIGMTLDKALEQEVELKRQYDNDAEVRELIDLARSPRRTRAQRRHPCGRRRDRTLRAHGFHTPVLRRGAVPPPSPNSTKTMSKRRVW